MIHAIFFSVTDLVAEKEIVAAVIFFQSLIWGAEKKIAALAPFQGFLVFPGPGYLRLFHTECSHHRTDARLARPKVPTLAPYSAQPYDNQH